MFLLNNAIIDLVSAAASAMGTVRCAYSRVLFFTTTLFYNFSIVQDHEGFAMLFVFIGPYSTISQRVCVLCQSMQIHNFSSHFVIYLDFFRHPHEPRPTVNGCSSPFVRISSLCSQWRRLHLSHVVETDPHLGNMCHLTRSDGDSECKGHVENGEPEFNIWSVPTISNWLSFLPK